MFSRAATARIALALCTIVFILPAPAQQTADPSAALLGRWRSLQTSRGGIGSMLEFREGHDVDYSPGAVVEMPWRVEGDELVLPAATRDGVEQREHITWLDDDRIRLRSAAAGDPGEELVRQGPRASAPSPIVGEWVGARDMAGHRVKVDFFFHPDGKGLLLIPFVTEHGSYSAASGRLRLALAGKAETETEFKVEGNVLTLTTGDSREMKYGRY